MSTTRLESFSDGVLAVAITLLVLDIRVPEVTSSSTLAHRLLDQWPSYAAYVVSFITIGIIWVNHHAMIGRLREADHSILMINLLLLLSIAVLPFATSLLARYLREGHGQHLAAGVYSGAFLLMSLIFVFEQRHVLFTRGHLVHTHITSEQRRLILRRGASGVIPYVVATALAPVSPYATLAICAAVAAFYASPLATPGAGSPGNAV